MTESEQPVKRPVGRPTLYDPALCEKVIELGKLGKSIEQIASHLGFSLRVFYKWRDEYEDFMHAMEDAKQYEQYWWEEQAQAFLIENKESDKINTTMWSRSMAARFPKKYRESTKTEITGADGAPLLSGIQVSFVSPDGHKQSD